MALSGKRIFITGGAGFIGTTIARLLVDENEIVAFDNLHRDALTGTDLAAHPNLTFLQGDLLDAEAVTRAAEGATHIIHCGAIAGVDTVRESPVRTMRVNLIGTYNVLEAAIATQGLERLVEFSTSEVFGTYAFRVAETSVTTTGRSARPAGRTRSRSSPGSTWRTPTTMSSACRACPCVPSTCSGRARSVAVRFAPSSRPRSRVAT